MRLVCIASPAIALLAWWLIFPVVNHARGTAHDMSVELVQQPFIEGEQLVYRWTGTIDRSCPVTIRRIVIDSEGVVTTLLARNFPAQPLDMLGKHSYEIRVDVPARIAEGPAIYQATEVPACDWLQRWFPVAIPYPPVDFVVTRHP